MVDLLKNAIAEKVAYVPGDSFYPDGQEGRHHMRLNFSYCKQVIVEGIRRLGNALKP